MVYSNCSKSHAWQVTLFITYIAKTMQLCISTYVHVGITNSKNLLTVYENKLPK